MIAADTNTWIAYLEGQSSEDTVLLDQALIQSQLLMPPVVLSELLSDPDLPPGVAEELSEVPLIDITEGFWERAGLLRAKVLSMRRKARLGDALIAQSCLDRSVPLLTRDRDFRAFADAAGLQVVINR